MSRLLWLSHFAPYPATGHGALQRTHHLLAQAAQRFETHLVALAPAGTFPSDAARQEAEYALQQMTASARIFALPDRYRRARTAVRLARAAVSRPTYWEHQFAHAGAAAHVRDLIRRIPFDLAHLDTIFLCGYVPLLGHIPFVLNHHNIESHLLHRRADRMRGPARAFFRQQARATAALERTFGARAASNLVVSDLDGDRLRELAPQARIETIPNGVDVTFFAPDAAEPVRPRSLVWAGGMDWFPNADAIEWFATALWPALAADDPERTATIVGRHPPGRAVALAASDPRVQVLGFVDDVRLYVRQAATYICPIRVGGGTRLKVLDALALGRPLVATRIGVEGLGLENGTHYLEANDVAETVAQVRRLEHDPRLAARLAGAGRAFALATYSWDRIGHRLVGVYDEVLTRRATPDMAARAPRMH
ncbi:MAG: glycosyltransferase family 4 protein [Candidatus Eremiobacteraeota bacterium]|nr:glycosyltransferase family 4 protein [Candidatus Eremiobacteraeota bacterium]